MKNSILITLLLIPMVNFSQYFGPEINDSVIKKNNVSKCIEYNIIDSVNFFNNYKNGFYWIYNYEGKVIERNSYSHGFDEKSESSLNEFAIHYIYDNLGRNILWLWYNKNYLSKITRVRIEEYDSLGNNFGYRDFSGSEKYSHAYETKFYSKTKNEIQIEIVDSVITNSKKEFYYFKDQTKHDTLKHLIEFYSINQIDSVITYFNKESDYDKQVQTYNYYPSLKLEQYEIESYNKDGELVSSYKTEYLENGLPIKKQYFFNFKNERIETFTAFSYDYFKYSEN